MSVPTSGFLPLHQNQVRRLVRSKHLLLIPALGILGAFFVYPLLYVLVQSLPDGSTRFYETLFETPVYLKAIGRTFQTAATVTLICVLLGYPYAYAMVRASRGLRSVLMVALLLPFWVSLLLRTFAWMILLQDNGVINKLLLSAGIIDQPLSLIRNSTGVVIGMTHILLPYAVLSIYAVVSKIDFRLVEASVICGASTVRTFARVLLPLSVQGVLAAAVLTFTLSLGFYITPALLGGPRDTMIGQLIAAQIGEQLNFGFGSALSVVLLAITAICAVLFGLLRVARPGKRGIATA